ncbi:hypothetical protein MC885_004405 [Smutsia gigantea]|nr:hypothetical protein MC885_004405 [Smutsia gigantea]
MSSAAKPGLSSGAGCALAGDHPARQCASQPASRRGPSGLRPAALRTRAKAEEECRLSEPDLAVGYRAGRGPMGTRGRRATGYRQADLRRPGYLRSWPGPAREKEAARAAGSACGKEGLVGGEEGREEPMARNGAKPCELDQEKYDADDNVKIICLGDSAVGKSNQPQQLSTYALTLYKHTATVDGRTILVVSLLLALALCLSHHPHTNRCTPTPLLAHAGALCPYNTYIQALWSLCHPILPTCVLCFCTQRPAQRPSGHLGLSALQHPSVSQSYIYIADFWDTAGQERFQSMHASYYHKAHACIMVFDVQRKVTYKNLSAWYTELREFRPKIPCIVVANKIDADIKMTQKSFNFARKFSLPLYFVSAADGTNVVKNFELEQKEEDMPGQEQHDSTGSPSPS